jgi:ferredoxin-NADP reductase
MQLTLVETRRDTSDTRTFFFTGSPTPQWKAGQYICYKLPHPDPDDRGIERYFSISTAPHEGRVAITCRFAEKSSSFKRALGALPMGGKIEAQAPEGDFCVDQVAKPLVFIAGGIGITPFRAILLDLERRGQPLNVRLLYANRNDEVVFRDELESIRARHRDLKIEYLIGENKLDGGAIRKAVPDLAAAKVYVSGPEPMVESMDKTLENLGLRKEEIMNDFFPGYTWP